MDITRILPVWLYYMKHEFKIIQEAIKWRFYVLLLLNCGLTFGGKQAIIWLPATLTDTPDVTLQTSKRDPVSAVLQQDNPADMSKPATWKPQLNS
jgi:hypothetical protein